MAEESEGKYREKTKRQLMVEPKTLQKRVMKGLYTKQLETLFNIGATVSQTLNLEELLDAVLDKLMETMNVEASGIFLLDAKTKNLILRAHRGMSPKLVREVRQIGSDDRLIGRVAKSGKALLIKDVSTKPSLAKSRARAEKFQSFAAVPIISKEKILGVMGVGSHKYREFPKWEVRMLDTIANQIGMAIENAQLYERALELAFTDGLTGLYNRRYLMEQIEREFRRAERSRTPLSLIMVDLDGLKAVNDNFGHHQGDIFLSEVGKIIKVNTRASDVAARWGGDEFMLLAPETDSSRSSKIAERIRSQVGRYRLSVNGNRVGITISAGVVSYPAHAACISELLKNVDEAMYNAKRGGKNRTCIFLP
jgi:diguanylate cyclase (GGDEF)-like protein